MSDTGNEGHRGRTALVVPIVIAVVGLGAVVVLEDAPTRHGVEGNLTSRSTHALTDAGLGGVRVEFIGRDGTIYAHTDTEGDRALVIVANLNGVRTARVIVDGTGVPTPYPSPSVTVSTSPSLPLTDPAPSSTTISATGPTGTTPAAITSPSTTASPSTTDDVRTRINALRHIEFATGSAALNATSRSVLAKVASILTANPDTRIRIEGNTDSVGAASMNLMLSKARARSVYTALRALGIAANRMTMIGYGETRPRVPNDTAAHRSVNRRVDMAVL